MKQLEKENEIINTVISEDTQGFLLEYYFNGLFGEDKNFTKGLTLSDYDIILSTDEAEDEELFHSLNICNTKFDPETAPSRKVIDFEDLESIVQPFVDGRKIAEQEFKEVTIHVYPKIRRNLRFNICSLPYKIVKNRQNGQKIVDDYKMEHENDNPGKKDILCICTFKLDGKKHKLEKILQLLEQFKDPTLQEFWNDHRIAYIIFCVKEEKNILPEYDMFPEEIKTINEKYTNVRMIFYLDPPGEDEKENLNMFDFNDFGKNFYFHMNSEHEIYRADGMLCSGDIIENSIKRKKKEKEDKKRNRALGKTQEQLIMERNEAFLTFFNFLKNIKDYKYSLYMSFKFELCLKYDKNTQLRISYIDFSHIIAELRTKEYQIINRCAQILNPDLIEIEEIPTIDINIDFLYNKCSKCLKIINDHEDMYFCYKCNKKWCNKCVRYNFLSKIGKGKFIDQNHNVLYFKTRNKEHFKNIDKHKLGKDLFAQCFNSNELIPHNATCKGCKQGFDDSPRYLCLHCRPGKVYDEGYFDYCYNCVQEMMKKTIYGNQIQLNVTDRIYNEETRILYNATETYRHDNDNHVYLMIALEYKHNNNDNSYYEF